MAASGRGGKRAPSARMAPAGPGKFSNRTDGQKLDVPNVDSSPDLEYGDRGRLMDAQRVARIAQPSSGPPSAGAPPLGGRPLAPGPMPSHISDRPSARPNEPITAGMASGPGPGPEALNAPPGQPDQRQQVLMYLATNFGNASAIKMLEGIQKENQAQPPVSPPPMGSPAPPSSPTPPPPSGAPVG